MFQNFAANSNLMRYTMHRTNSFYPPLCWSDDISDWQQNCLICCIYRLATVRTKSFPPCAKCGPIKREAGRMIDTMFATLPKLCHGKGNQWSDVQVAEFVCSKVGESYTMPWMSLQRSRAVNVNFTFCLINNVCEKAKNKNLHPSRRTKHCQRF